VEQIDIVRVINTSQDRTKMLGPATLQGTSENVVYYSTKTKNKKNICYLCRNSLLIWQ